MNEKRTLSIEIPVPEDTPQQLINDIASQLASLATTLHWVNGGSGLKVDDVRLILHAEDTNDSTETEAGS